MSAPPRGRPAADVAELVPLAVLEDAAGAPLRTVPDANGAGEVFGAPQRAALEVRDRLTLVSAGAGAGKTSVLVERCLRLLLEDEGLAAGDLLAITFTQRAAAQMRDRIRTRLDALLRAGGVPRERLPERLRVEDAWIGTYHAIAARLLRRFALDAGLDPDVRVLEEGESRELLREAFDASLSRWLQEHGEDAMELLVRIGPRALGSQTLDLLARRRSQGREPAHGEEHGLPVPPEDGPAVAAAERALAAEILVLGGRAASEIADGLGTAAPSATVRRALGALADIAADPALGAGELPSGGVLDGWRAGLRAGNTKALKGEAPDAVRAAVAAGLQAADHRVAAPRARRDLALRSSLLVAVARRHRTAKRDAGVLDFDDLLLRLLALLDARPHLAEVLRERFRHVVVDEYQDSNRLQAELLRRIALPERSFVVGDRLQAIYGFRFATVEEFDATAREADRVGARLELDETFRCPGDVIAVVNHVGAAAHAGYQPLRGGHDDPPRGDGPAVAVHLVAEDRPARAGGAAPAERDPDGDEEDEDDEEPLPQVAPDEARHVAGEVARLVASGHAAHEIALLVRATTRTGGLELALLERGVDVLPAAGGSLLETLEARELEAWLAACTNAHDDVALLGALRLPTAGVDADALVPLVAVHRAARRAAVDPDGGPALWETLDALDVAALDAPPAAQDHLEAQRDLLRRHRLALVTGGAAAVLERILADEGYRASLLARPGGARRWAGAVATVDWVTERELAGDGPRELLDRIAAQREAGPAVPVLADADAVTITTVHKAKGLEWPVVLAVDLGSRRRPHRAPVALGTAPGDDRVGMKVLVDGRELELWDRPALEAERRAAEAAEERRLVHVAMTRAKERLVLTGTWKRAKDDDRHLDRAGVRRVAEHDLVPTSATLQWLVPLLAEPEAWPAVGEACTLRVADPADPDRDAVAVELRVIEPRDAPAGETSPDRSAAGPARVGSDPAAAAAPGPGDAPAPSPTDDDAGAGEGADPARPRYPLRSPASFTSVIRRLREAEPDGAWTPEDPEPGELGAALRGSVVHALLEARLGAPAVPTGPTPPSDVVAVVRDADPRLEVRPERLAEVAATVDALIATEPGRRAVATPPARRRVERSVLLDVDADRPLLHGALDLWLEGDDGAVTIVDWKTNRLDDGRGPARVVEDDYALQRAVYALAALQAGHPAVDVWFVFSAAPGEPVVATYGPGDRDGLRAVVVAAIDAAQQIPPR